MVVVLDLSEGLQAEPRTWKSVDGKTLEAELVSSTDTEVTLRRSSEGEKFTIPLARLSEADQAFVRGNGAPGIDPEAERRLAGLMKELLEEVPKAQADPALRPGVEKKGQEFDEMLKKAAGGDPDRKNALTLRIASHLPAEMRAMMEKNVDAQMRSDCASRLSNIGLELFQFLLENDDRFPDRIEGLKQGDGGTVTMQLTDGKMARDPWGASYIYLGRGLKGSSPPRTPVLVQDPKGRKRVRVLYVDNSVSPLDVMADGSVFKAPHEKLNDLLK